MSYNKAKEERKWKKWKQAEENQLRALGVSEDIILRLRTYDWENFNKERQYRQRQVSWSHYIDSLSKQFLEFPILDEVSLLDSIEDERVLQVLMKESTLTLQIILYKMQGFSSEQIAKKTGMKASAVRQRICRLKRKF